jgi:hypothetical protein
LAVSAAALRNGCCAGTCGAPASSNTAVAPTHPDRLRMTTFLAASNSQNARQNMPFGHDLSIVTETAQRQWGF